MQGEAKIIFNEQVNPGFYHMEMEAPEIAKQAVPGQFLNIRVSDTLQPLLRKPISLYKIDAEKGILGILYQVRGLGTELLSRKTAGQNLDIMGPLGKRGFQLQPKGKEVVLVGGGIGVPPLYPLAEELIAQKKNVTVLLGFRNEDSAFSIEEFKALGCQVKVATDDGSLGIKGFTTQLMEEEIRSRTLDYVYACGPEIMLKKLEEICLRNKIAGESSLEAYMGCGIGACLGCAVEKRDSQGKKYAKVCVDGPVFSMGEVKLHE